MRRLINKSSPQPLCHRVDFDLVVDNYCTVVDQGVPSRRARCYVASMHLISALPASGHSIVLPRKALHVDLEGHL